MVGFLKFWRPRSLMETVNQNAESRIRNHSLGVILKGWSPFLLASIFIFVCGMPSLNQFLKFSSLTLPMPGLHEKVIDGYGAFTVSKSQMEMVRLRTAPLPRQRESFLVNPTRRRLVVRPPGIIARLSVSKKS